MLSSCKSIIFVLLIGSYTRIIQSHRVQDCSGEDVLRLVQIIHRHGNRTLVSSYQNDPYFNLKYFPEVFGMLTNVGRLLAYRMGQFFRRRYEGLLFPKFSPEKVYVVSTNVSSAIETAQYSLAALLGTNRYHPKKYITELELPPVNKISPDKAMLLYPVPCSKATKLQSEYSQSSKVIKIFDRYSNLCDFLTKNSGTPTNNNLTTMYFFYDALNIEYKRRLRLYDWAYEVLKTSNDVFSYFAANFLVSFSAGIELQKIRSGPLLKEILDRFTKTTMGLMDSEPVIWIYSGHDVTVSNILNALNVFNYRAVPLCASVHFELYQRGCDYYVQVFYRDDDSECLKPINIPGCGTKCSLNQLYKLYESILPGASDTFDSMCQL